MRTLLWLVPLLVLQIAWLGWFLGVQLPNAKNLGVFARRGLLLLSGFPGIIPDVTWTESLLGLAISKLAHVEYLPQRLPVVLGAALIAAAAIAIGDWTLRFLNFRNSLTAGERLPLCFGLGCSELGVLTLLLGRLGLLNPWLIRLLLAATVAGGLAVARPWRSWKNWIPRPTSWTSWLPLLVVLPFLWIMFLGSMLPSIDFDVIEYHLQGPKEYYQAGRIQFLPHNVYTSMPFGVEMLHLLGMELLDDWWWGALVGQLLVMMFAPATALLIASIARRGGSTRAAWIAAIVYLSTPWVYRLSLIAYVEGPLCFYHAALIWTVVFGASDRPRSEAPGDQNSTPPSRPPQIAALLGLLAGGAMACKYPGLISAVIPFGLVVLVDSARSRSARPILLFALGWGAIMAPWLGKNLIDTGNPVYPLQYRIFGGRHWDETLDRKFRDGHSPRPVTLSLFVESIVEVAGGSDWQSGLYLALVPLSLFRPGSRRLVLGLWLYAIYLFLTWWFLTHRIDRFWLPLLVPLAVLAGLGGDWIRSRAWSALLVVVLSIHVLTNFVYNTTSLAGFNEWTGDLVALRRDLPKRMDAPLAEVDRSLPPDAKILVVGQAAVFPVNHPIVYNTVFNEETLERLARDRTPDQFRKTLKDMGISHIYLDWQEIRRYRQPGNYGYTDYVTPELLKSWVDSGILDKPLVLAPLHELYRVR